MRTRKFLSATMLATVAALLFAGCEPPPENSGLAADNSDISSTQLALTDARTLVVQEASLAMTGSSTTYTGSNWPTGTLLSNSYYTLTNTAAWTGLLNLPIYKNGSITGWYVSCMRTRAEGPLYTCQLSSGFGSFEMPYYTCQGSCPSLKMHGGQCKPFMNLIAYRAGVYKNSDGSIKPLPSDPVISGYPLATYNTIQPGDLLRRTTPPTQHAAIVVRKIDANTVVVFDSNWVGGGDGAEVAGSHVLGFSGSGGITDLNTYHVLSCVYSGTC